MVSYKARCGEPIIMVSYKARRSEPIIMVSYKARCSEPEKRSVTLVGGNSVITVSFKKCCHDGL